jgi:hypothetical protein
VRELREVRGERGERGEREWGDVREICVSEGERESGESER